MNWRRAIFAAAVLAASRSIPAWGWSVWTKGGDNTRQGAFQAETVLTPANVNPAQFGLIKSVPVNGSIFAQPLYVPGVYINGATHNAIYVATQYGALYAIDADTGAYLWSENLDTVSPHTYNCDEADGIFGTPVIDVPTRTLYAVVAAHDNGTMLQQLLAIDITSGNIKARRAIQPPGFDPTYALQRGALTLANGAVYVPEAVLCDSPYDTRSTPMNPGGAHGWEMVYGKNYLRGVVAFNTTPGGYGADIWGGGAGAVVDTYNNVYFETGNGDFNVSVQDYGDSVLKLSPFSVTDYFTPQNEGYREAEDEDLGSGGNVQLPYGLMLVTGKMGIVYVVNQWNMGHKQAGDAGVVQEWNPGGEMFSTPVFWNNTIYMGPGTEGGGNKVSAYAFNPATGRVNTTPTSQTAELFGFPGGILWVTSNGTQNGILWALEFAKTGQTLHAYDATDLTHELGNWPAGGRGSEFRSFMCAGGHCYVNSGDYALEIFGPK